MSISSLDPLALPESTHIQDLRKTGAHPDFWYPLARSHDIKPGKVIGRRFAGDPVALVRTKSGRVFALEDRCAHRQVPLHAGIVDGEEIQCGYHGWRFDCAGSCVNIPYVGNSKVAPRGVRSYPCREAYGLIFIFPGDPDKAEQAAFPDISTWNDSHYKTRFLDDQVQCHYSFLHENLMDMNHQFLHRRIMSKIKTTYLGLREGDDWVEVDYTFSREGTQPLGEKFILGERSKDPSQHAKDLMTIRLQYPYQILKFWTESGPHPVLDLWITYVPVDDKQRINHTFGLINIRKPSVPGIIHLLWPFIVYFTDGIFKEDRWIVELEQKAFDEQGEDRNQEIFHVVKKVRQLLLRKGVPIPAYQE